MTTLVRGQNAPLGGAAPYTVVVTHDPGPEVDLTGFLLGEDRRVVNEDGMVFYNQPALDGYPGVSWRAAAAGRHELVLDPSFWPADLVRVRVGVTVTGGTFGGVRGLAAHVTDASGAVVATLDLGAPDRQDALIVAEVYRHGGGLKVRCVGDGFTDGLHGLATDAGITVAEDDEPAPAALNSRVNLTKPAADAPKIDLRKYEVSVALTKNDLADRTFRVVLAIDASGSMKAMYRNGTVQRSLERMVAIADVLDDDGRMEVWFFGDFPVRSAPATVGTMGDYVEANAAAKKKAEGGNYEPRVMKEIVDWTQAEPSPYPTLVLFWSDGGVHAEKKIVETLVKSSRLPIFWMFLGLGRAEYGVLARLDNVTGGVVDNAGFIPIDDIDRYPDADMYGQIFGNFVKPWVAAATAAGVL
ncbi:VWA domain-containing protein [Virgisporangium aurantiacum]|uniref:Tellurium resistance protein n=1 Tax=Virgisporangium aurantiacum TaxID=175570 RepID=A0A8J3Z1W7_9ACTN|nr:VWA domain-containing protein [Virgisporangium aurantiacum]GIJ55921.1 tellurium resistance protein [Virgisporangium aurantiacum]